MRLVILVVDDDRQILQLFARLMRNRHEVILEYDGKKALERLLSDEEIDVTFLDMMLGIGPSGAEILAKLQEHAPARLERIAIATGAIGIPGIEEVIERYRAPTTGKPIPVIEKPYSVTQIDYILRPFLMCPKPRGPRYSAPPAPETPRPSHHDHTAPQKHPSRPMLPDYDDKEISEVSSLADHHDPIAVAIRDNRRDVADVRERTAKLEAHFEDNGPGKRGLVRQIDVNVEAIRTSFSFVKVMIPIMAVLATGLVWLILALQPKPETVDYNRIRRELNAAPTMTATSSKP